MIDQLAFIAAVLLAVIGCLAMVAWLGVILLVNPALDPLFYNDKYFDWFLQRAHPFFFSFRAMWYAGAVTSRWLAKRSMGIVEDSFRARVGAVGRLCSWVLMACVFSLPLVAAAFLILDFVSKH